MAELDKLLQRFQEVLRPRPTSIHMPKVMAFALFSTRRQEEIVRIRWDDLDPSRKAVLVRDMKNPEINGEMTFGAVSLMKPGQ